VNFKKALPEKDFKARVRDGKVLEVSIHIFDEECFAFQPFYKMDKATAAAWIKRVEEFIDRGEDKCYAENALNEIFPALNVRAFDYNGYYVDEIDNVQDWARVKEEILPFDEADAMIFA
jgi:CTP:phosphocholine cytidylyltransferase-like protein